MSLHPLITPTWDACLSPLAEPRPVPTTQEAMDLSASSRNHNSFSHPPPPEVWNIPLIIGLRVPSLCETAFFDPAFHLSLKRDKDDSISFHLHFHLFPFHRRWAKAVPMKEFPKCVHSNSLNWWSENNKKPQHTPTPMYAHRNTLFTLTYQQADIFGNDQLFYDYSEHSVTTSVLYSNKVSNKERQWYLHQWVSPIYRCVPWNSHETTASMSDKADNPAFNFDPDTKIFGHILWLIRSQKAW